MYRYGEREQVNMLPSTIDDYVSSKDPVRVYDTFVEALKLEELGIVEHDVKVGNSEYNPRSMIKLLIYGYSYGVRSSRKLEREVYHNLSFIWLMGGLKPDHKTISRFRKNNKDAIKNILKQSVRMCIDLELIEGNTLFVDGSKIRGNASISNSWTSKKCDKQLKRIDRRIEEILKEAEAVDESEQDKESLVEVSKELEDKKLLKSKIQDILEKLKEENVKSINTIDSDCVKFKSRQGSHAGYNGQIVVDEKNGLIVNTDVVSQNNDLSQFANQIGQANETLGKDCQNACADAGYANTNVLKEVDDKGVNVVVPTQKQSRNKESGSFDKERFKYDKKNNCYVCPEGNVLEDSHYAEAKDHKRYRFSDPSICGSCRHFNVCTKSKSGRVIIRLLNEDVKEKLEKQYMLKQNQNIYKLRKQKVELPFGHFKRNLGISSFLLRGRNGANAEMSLFGACFNIARMITLVGTTQLIQKLAY